MQIKILSIYLNTLFKFFKINNYVYINLNYSDILLINNKIEFYLIIYFIIPYC